MPATERPRLRTRLAALYTTAAVVLGAVPVAVVGLGAWTGRSTQAVGAIAGGGTASNTGPVLVAVVVGLIVVALVAAPIGWALAGRALRPVRELTSAAEGATADRLPEHGELGRYEEFADLSAKLAGLYTRLDAAYAAQRRFVADASHELRTPLTVHARSCCASGTNCSGWSLPCWRWRRASRARWLANRSTWPCSPPRR